MRRYEMPMYNARRQGILIFSVEIRAVVVPANTKTRTLVRPLFPQWIPFECRTRKKRDIPVDVSLYSPISSYHGSSKLLLRISSGIKFLVYFSRPIVTWFRWHERSKENFCPRLVHVGFEAQTFAYNSLSTPSSSSSSSPVPIRSLPSLFLCIPEKREFPFRVKTHPLLANNRRATRIYSLSSVKGKEMGKKKEKEKWKESTHVNVITERTREL